MNLMCHTFRLTVDSVGLPGIAGPLAVHAEHCHECRPTYAVLVTMHDQLRALPMDQHRAPEGFQPGVMGALGPGLVPDLGRRSPKVVPIAAAVATAAVATAAAGTVVILKLRRVRAA